MFESSLVLGFPWANWFYMGIRTLASVKSRELKGLMKFRTILLVTETGTRVHCYMNSFPTHGCSDSIFIWNLSLNAIAEVCLQSLEKEINNQLSLCFSMQFFIWIGYREIWKYHSGRKGCAFLSEDLSDVMWRMMDKTVHCLVSFLIIFPDI